jgi:hypothetical protein
MSAFVSLRGVQEPVPSPSLSFTSYTWRMRRNGIPSCADLLDVSILISGRLGISLRKYGPPICWGVPSTSTSDGVSIMLGLLIHFFGLPRVQVIGKEKGVVVLIIVVKEGQKNSVLG